MQDGTASDAAEPDEGSGEAVGGGAVMAAVHDTTESPSCTVSAEAVVLDSKIFVSLYICLASQLRAAQVTA
eukprot:396671-Pyramimonas_sp.AAC.1